MFEIIFRFYWLIATLMFLLKKVNIGSKIITSFGKRAKGNHRCQWKFQKQKRHDILNAHSSTIVTEVPDSIQLNPSICTVGSQFQSNRTKDLFGSHSLQQQLLLTLIGYCVLVHKKQQLLQSSSSDRSKCLTQGKSDRIEMNPNKKKQQQKCKISNKTDIFQQAEMELKKLLQVLAKVIH